MKNLNPLSSLCSYTLFIVCFFLVSCGGENEGEETAEQTSDQTEKPTTPESNNLNTQANDVAPADDTELPPAVVEVKKQPNPNGVYFTNWRRKK
jgi:PBP1b-binding outer membrane lipoprotein LpoB